MPVTVAQTLPTAVAVGAHLKNSVAIALNSDVFVSQHIGDLESAEAYRAFETVLVDLQKLYKLNLQSWLAICTLITSPPNELVNTLCRQLPFNIITLTS